MYEKFYAILEKIRENSKHFTVRKLFCVTSLLSTNAHQHNTNRIDLQYWIGNKLMDVITLKEEGSKFIFHVRYENSHQWWKQPRRGRFSYQQLFVKSKVEIIFLENDFFVRIHSTSSFKVTNWVGDQLMAMRR